MPSLPIFPEFSRFSSWFPFFRITLSIFNILLFLQTYIIITIFNDCAIINFSQKSLKGPAIGVYD